MTLLRSRLKPLFLQFKMLLGECCREGGLLCSGLVAEYRFGSGVRVRLEELVFFELCVV